MNINHACAVLPEASPPPPPPLAAPRSLSGRLLAFSRSHSTSPGWQGRQTCGMQGWLCSGVKLQACLVAAVLSPAVCPTSDGSHHGPTEPESHHSPTKAHLAAEAAVASHILVAPHIDWILLALAKLCPLGAGFVVVAALARCLRRRCSLHTGPWVEWLDMGPTAAGRVGKAESWQFMALPQRTACNNLYAVP